MTVITLIAWLKRAWDVIKKILGFLWEYKTIIVIALLLFIISILRNDIKDVIQEKEKVVQEFHDYKVEQEVELLEERIKTKDLEVDLLNKQNKLEMEYNEKLHTMYSDVLVTRDRANSLSIKLKESNDKLSTLTKEQANRYTIALSNISADCTARYTEMGEHAERHKLAEYNAVAKYNSLVDVQEK